MADRSESPNRFSALQRLTRHPALTDVLPSLPAATLKRLYDAVGLHDAGPLMALTPGPLLVQALTEAVWTEQRGRTELDADVFVDWLEIWLSEGQPFAAERLLALDEDLLAACLGALLEVADTTVDGLHRWSCDDDGGNPWDGAPPLPSDASTIIDRFAVTAVREDEWELVHHALLALWDEAPDALLRLLQRLTLDDGRLEGEEVRYRIHEDAAAEREQGRERAGFVPRAAARAFLGQARVLSPGEILAMTEYDPESARHLGRLDPAGSESPSGGSRPAAASGPRVASTEYRDRVVAPTVSGSAPDLEGAEIWTLLSAAGILDQPAPAGLLTGPENRPLPLQIRLDRLAAEDPAALARTASELAYLANVLLTLDLLPASRGAEEAARELAFATANLGLELLERHGAGVDLERPPGLVRGFLLAWRTLLDLPSHLVRAVAQALDTPRMRAYLQARAWLGVQMSESLADLQHAVDERDVESAREALALLSLALDTGACRAAAHLLDNPPRFPGLLEGADDKDAARWITTVDDLERLGRLMRAF